MGTPEFAVPSLTILIDNGYTIPAVVTAPDKPRGRGQELSPTPVKTVALQHNIPLLQPGSLRDPGFVGQLRALRPDLIVVVAFRILPPEVFTTPRLGSFNLHASLLPKYRGAAPINWAIIKGEKETGVTTFLLQEKVDTGGIILQARVPIGEDDDAGSVHDKLAEVGSEIVLHTVRLIEQGKAHPRQQDESLTSAAPKIFKEDCRIAWDRPAREVQNFIRGLSPYPAAFTTHKGKVIKIFKALTGATAANHPPGTVYATPTSFDVATSDAPLKIVELQQEGRRRMGVEEFLRGYRISSGERLE
jgi:methionyl-tRNA formyltransferase